LTYDHVEELELGGKSNGDGIDFDDIHMDPEDY
jgi:hypothetical protein